MCILALSDCWTYLSANISYSLLYIGGDSETLMIKDPNFKSTIILFVLLVGEPVLFTNGHISVEQMVF